MKIQFENTTINNLSICNDCTDYSFTAKNELSVDGKPTIVEKLERLVKKPEDLEPVTDKLGIPASLINYQLANPTDLSFLGIHGLSQVMDLPVLVSDSKGGRKSMFRIARGEQTFTGIYVDGNTVLKKFVTRITGDEEFASEGDEFVFSIVDLNGKLVYEASGKLEAYNEKQGKGEIKLKQTDSKQMADSLIIIIIYEKWIFSLKERLTIIVID